MENETFRFSNTDMWKLNEITFSIDLFNSEIQIEFIN